MDVMSLVQSLRERDCPFCATPASLAVNWLRSNLDEARLSKASFASRKVPEFMSYNLVRCPRCTVVFAREAPGRSVLAGAYHAADYSTADEASFAAQTYRAALEPFLQDSLQ